MSHNPETVLALSVRQPWAYAILRCDKDVENRDWNTSYRGPLLLHAGKSVGTKADFAESYDAVLEASGAVMICAQSYFRAYRPSSLIPDACLDERGVCCGAHLGGFLGLTRLADMIGPGGVHTKHVSRPHPKRVSPWYLDRYGFVLEDRTKLPFVPWKGQLGLFEVPVHELPPSYQRAIAAMRAKGLR